MGRGEEFQGGFPYENIAKISKFTKFYRIYVIFVGKIPTKKFK